MSTWEKPRAFFDWLLGRSRDHFASFLPAKIGLFAKLLLRLFFSKIPFADDDAGRLSELGKKGIVVYATKYKSRFEFLFLYSRLKALGAPFPQVAFDQKIWLWQPVTRAFRIVLAMLEHVFRFRCLPDPYASGYFTRELSDGHAGLVSLVDAEGFYRRFVKAGNDSLAHLIEFQAKSEKPVFLVPQLILYGKKPMRFQTSVTQTVFGTEEKPRWFRRAASVFSIPEKAISETGEAIDLSEFLSRPEHIGRGSAYLSNVLRMELVGRLNAMRRSILGPVLKTRQELKERILQNGDFRDFLKEHAAQTEKSERSAHRQADRYLEEIAAKYNTMTIAFLGQCVRWISTNMFDGIDYDPEDLKMLKNTARKGPLILVPCHRSHIDYLVISYLMYLNAMPCPLIAAGKNLSFWPMGTIFRNSGAFFLRRSFKGLPLYGRVFADYVTAVLSEGFNIEFFIEGGRSRTGKAVLPKFGLLSIILSAYKAGAVKDLYFCPIAIGYDRVIEEGSYLHEIEGGEKEAENLSQMVKARKFLKKRFGTIFVRCHEPLRLSDVLARFPVELGKMTIEEQEALLRNLGHRIILSINKVSVVTPHAVTAAAILSALPKSFSEEELLKSVELLLPHLAAARAELSDTLLDPPSAVRQAVSSYLADKFLIREGRGLPEGDEQDENPRYSVTESGRAGLEYYKNNMIAFVVPSGFTALAILSQDAFQFSAEDLHGHYRFLQDLFKNEFHYDPDLPAEHYTRKALKSFIDEGMLMPHQSLPDTYNISAQGRRKLMVLARFQKTYLESYLVVLRVFSENDAKGMDRKERDKKCRSMGRAMLKNGEIENPEALSKMNYENAARYFASRGIETRQDEEALSRYRGALEGYLKVFRT